MRYKQEEQAIQYIRRAIEKEMGTIPAALAIAWVLKNPHVASAITGATRMLQIDENLKALDVKITDDINQKIEDILQNKPVIKRYAD